jgi:zinc D-Ala-D-Ala carboxypeptidase
MKKIDLPIHITPHFTVNEFIANDVVDLPDYIVKNLIKLCEQLELIREKLGNKPMIIHSGYRTFQHNQTVGGRKHSFHLFGMAVDFTHSTLSPQAVQRCLNDWPGGMGCYTTFTHIDIRPYKARWKG